MTENEDPPNENNRRDKADDEDGSQPIPRMLKSVKMLLEIVTMIAWLLGK